MRRTTICRSERAALLALVAGLLAGLAPALKAQDTTQARPDTSTPPQDTSQAAPAPLGQLPATHVVATGETLWSIAQLYYSDPLLWPEIYRLNTSQIDDPHWIYPGQELSLTPGASVAQLPESTSVAPAPPTPGDTVHAAPARAHRGLSDDLRSAPHRHPGSTGRAAGLHESALPAAAAGRVLRRGLPDRKTAVSLRSCARQHVDPRHPAAHRPLDRDDVRPDLDPAAAGRIVPRW